MRVTFLLPEENLSGGVRVVGIYAERLRRRGHEVTVVSGRAQAPSLKEQVRRVLRGQWGRADSRSTPAPSHLDGALFRHDVIDRSRPIVDADVPDADVVVASWWETAEWVAGLSSRKGAKAYFVQHHEVFDYLPVERVRATYRLPFHKITISHWLVALMRDTYGDADVTHVPNSVDTEVFFAPPRAKQPHPTVGLMYYPDLVGIKGCDVSLRAFALAKEKLPDLRLVAFGVAPPSKELPLPEGSTFVLRPAQESIRDLYAACDVWLCGSRGEGFHLPPLEAMACRCPVVSTRVGGPMDIIEDGRQGFLFDVEDSDGLARGLVEVLSRPEESWRAMSDAAFATATAYSWEEATDKFEAGLRRAIDRDRDRALKANIKADLKAASTA
jgi:glycosyltransferase involved in cell wall biosynthesis